jgi:hypothetical protein
MHSFYVLASLRSSTPLNYYLDDLSNYYESYAHSNLTQIKMRLP